MQALTCPKCRAPLQAELTVCPYCGVGLAPDHEPASQNSRPALAPAQIPEGWVDYQDPWHGFRLAHPSGWQVITHQSQISIREDPIGLVAAIIWPFSLRAPASARQVAQQLIGVARRSAPSFQAWQQSNAAADSNRITIKTRETRFGQQLEGNLNILVNGLNVIVSGFAAPVQAVSQYSQVMAQILSTFRVTELMPRQSFSDPSEGAFSVDAPQGWIFRGGVNRNNIGGSGTTQYNVSRDPQGLVTAGMPTYSWVYMDGMSGMMGGVVGVFSGYPALRYMPAVQFCTQSVAPWMVQGQANFKVERVEDRPDIAEIFVADLAQSGIMPNMYEVTAAILETSYNENGVQIRQKSRVFTQRQRGGVGTFAASAPLWTGGLDIYYRAPEAEFATWEPVLQGILDSFQINPAWKQGEQRLAQNFIANSQQDIMRRTSQISQTLQETSDLITKGYWDRQATYDRLSEMRSNATLGVQNVVSSSGDVYKVPYGYDQYWADGLGNLYGGSWSAQPDINWTPLEPTGI